MQGLIIYSPSFNQYVTYKGKIIVFHCSEEIAAFLDAFINDAILRVLQINLFQIGVVTKFRNSCEIQELVNGMFKEDKLIDIDEVRRLATIRY